jgi:hypothetical protein
VNTAYGRYGGYGAYSWYNPLTWNQPAEAAQQPHEDYSLRQVIRDPDTGQREELPQKHQEWVAAGKPRGEPKPGEKIAAGTPHSTGSWLKANWPYLVAGTVILAAGIGVAAWKPGGRRTNPKGLTTQGLILRLAGMAAGMVLVVIPEPLTTMAGVGLVVVSAGSTLNAVSGDNK